MTDPIEVTRATYDAIAGRYAQLWDGPPAWLAEEIAWLRRSLPDGARLADVGCGPGHHTAALRESGFDVAGFDLSLGMLAARGVPGLVRADMRALPVAAASLDAIWCSAALLHVPRADVPVVLAGFARVLRPGGLLALSVAEGDGEIWEPTAHRLPHPRFYVLHRAAPLTDLLTTAGFTVDHLTRRSTSRNWLTLRAHLPHPDPPAA